MFFLILRRMKHVVRFPVLLAIALCAASCARGPVSQFRHGKFDKAAAGFEQAVKEAPDDGNLRAWLGVAQWKAGRHDDALQSFRAAADLMQTNPTPLEFEACVLMSQEKWIPAEKALQKALDISPANPRILTRLAAAKLGTGNMTSAKAYLEKARALDPSYPPALFNLAWLHYTWPGPKDAARDLFERYLAVADDKEHEEAARKALEDIKHPRQSARQEASNEVNRGIASYKSREWTDAVKCFSRAAAADPSWDTAFHNLGMAHSANNDQKAAIAAFEKAIALNPKRTDSRYSLAFARNNSGDKTGARKDLESLVKTSPNYADAHYLLGVINSSDRKTRAKARENFKRYLDLAPRGPYSAAARQWLNAEQR